jgi:prepilin-type N-terminal cleavage/methylation domain-containing protein
MRRAGLTLIEVLLVLAIIGTVAGIGILSLRNYLNNQALQQAALETAGLLSRVGGRAINESQAYHIHVTLGSGTLTWHPDSDTANARLVTTGLPSGVTVQGVVGDGTNEIRYTGRGLPLQQYELTLAYKGLTRRVILLATGKVIVR